MVKVTVSWTESHNDEQSAAISDFHIKATADGKLVTTEFASDGSPVMEFIDEASADEYIALVSPWGPAKVVKE